MRGMWACRWWARWESDRSIDQLIAITITITITTRVVIRLRYSTVRIDGVVDGGGFDPWKGYNTVKSVE